jgi:hypothetical protein
MKRFLYALDLNRRRMPPKRAKIMAASQYLYTSVAGELSKPAAPFVNYAWIVADPEITTQYTERG